ncbi:TlpA family protein disulfide reductase [Pinibacter soli]|uniref:TlpA disulfide reductase family protein n=1 Tax=Pinibacter soli TaxID=3044211 RepID=A0ABT6RFY2_9BACT|nr:TlpA disulfide reductase family protein [Pinibacter soli]MDI3321477.1 TlpA disulfide reductase family protein [Pinibacter soli]
MVFNAYAAGSKPTEVNCHVHNNKGSAVFLYRVKNGQAMSLGFKRPDAKNNCKFSFEADSDAIYFLRKGGAHLFEFTHVIYLHPGDQQKVDIYPNDLGIDFDSIKIANPNKETVSLKKWVSVFNQSYKQVTNRNQRDQFLETYKTLLATADEIKKTGVTSNKDFNKLLVEKINTEVLFLKAAAFFYAGERMNAGYDTTASRQWFYETLGKEKIDRTDLLQSEHGLEMLNYLLGYQFFQQYKNGEQMLGVPFLEKIKKIENDTVRAVYATAHMEQLTNYEQFVLEIQPFKQIITNAGLQGNYQKKYDKLSLYAKGKPAYNFSLYDNNDKHYSLTDFKGKVVVLDIWAMWCAPCLAEKPNFKKLEEEYKGQNDIVFLGVSVDGLSRKEVWKDFVAKKGYTNIEMLSNFEESIMKYYNIGGIPRFMVFDKEGKIVSVDAPRPSSPALKELIEETLKKNDHAIGN